MLGANDLTCKIAVLDSGIDLENYESHVMKYIEYTEKTDGEVFLIQMVMVHCVVRLCFQ